LGKDLNENNPQNINSMRGQEEIMSEVIQVVVADDHEIVRKGIIALLATEQDIQVVGEAGDGQAAISQAGDLHPDVVLMDLVMPVMDGIQATQEITARWPDIKVLVLTSFAADDKVFPAIKAGALGYLLKDTSPDQLLAAIHQVYRGEPSLEPAIARKVLHELVHPPSAKPTTDPLTERELEVLRLVAQGGSNREISEQLVVAEWTIRTHVSNILSKLHLASRTQAALYALRTGIASIEDIPYSVDKEK
jgi:NarL family two-component system response regulator LiaR